MQRTALLGAQGVQQLSAIGSALCRANAQVNTVQITLQPKLHFTRDSSLLPLQPAVGTIKQYRRYDMSYSTSVQTSRRNVSNPF